MTEGDAFDRLLAALRAFGRTVRMRGSDAARASCPTHPDRRPSLAVTRRDRRVLVRCFAGCRTAAVLQALGLRMADLFDGPPAPAMRRKCVQSYAYAADGTDALVEKVRFEPKGFRWRVADAARPDGWRWDLRGAIPRLYRIDELIEEHRVVLVEGEKAVELLWSRGVAATCGSAGASSWLPAWTESLWRAGCREVLILPDADEPGRRHAERVARACYDFVPPIDVVDDDDWPTEPPSQIEMAGLSVKVVALPGLTHGGDVVDWMEAGRDVVDLRLVIGRAPTWTPEFEQRSKLEQRRLRGAERQRRFRSRARAARQAFVAPEDPAAIYTRLGSAGRRLA